MKALAGVALFALTFLPLSAAAQSTTTITKTYTYNADGALTSIATQVDDEDPTVSYLTWDNFVPDAGDPSTGELAAGNGNLIGVGPEPGTNFAKQFTFDGQDRLIGYSDGTNAVSYTYYPTWMMASATKGSGDSIHFYHDDSKPPRIVTIERPASGVLSRQLGPLCSLTDGTRKVLMRPRKDVAGVYDPDTQTFSPYSYDAYGQQSPFDPSQSEMAGAEYDLADNSFRYAGEYRDPDWGGYYLRHRWYDPELRGFLSRDPAPNLNRYGYTDGNPIARVDPTGRSHTSWNKLVRNPVDKLTARIDKHLADRLFLGPVIGPVALIADPVGFWHGLGPSNALRLLSLTGIVASQALSETVLGDSNYLASFFFRVGTNSAVGTAASYVAASSHGFHRLNRRTFFHGLEYTAGNIFEANFIAGHGYRPFNLELEDVVEKWEGENVSLRENNEALVFRYRQNALNGVVRGKYLSFLRTSSPILDAFGTGLYHEGMLALGADGDLWLTELTGDGLRVQVYTDPIEKESLQEILQFSKTELHYVGKFDNELVNDVFHTNPRNLVPKPDGIFISAKGDALLGGNQPYNLFGNNCQNHAADILRALGKPR